MAIAADDLVTSNEGIQRGLFHPSPGYPVGWYAVALSDSLVPGELRPLELCDGHLVMYRGEDGVVRVMTPYCPHMGADLSVGDVRGNDVRCPFHHWQFGPDGACSHIPTGDRITRTMRVYPFTVQERWGLIWVFWGDEPTYEIPSLPGWDEDTWVVRAVEMPMDGKFTKEPWVFSTNVFDFAHFNVVHGIPDLTPDIEVTWNDLGASYSMTMKHELIGVKKTRAALLGTNIVITDSVRGDERMAHISIGSPLGPELGTKYFGVFATPRTEVAERTLDQLVEYQARIINDDLKILSSIQFGNDHLGASDKHMIKYLRWYHAWPKRTIGDFKVRVDERSSAATGQPVDVRR